jgi:phage baseplate assembly protein gpV
MRMVATWQGDVPASAGNTAVWRVPYKDGAALTFNLSRAYARVETAGSQSTVIQVQASPAGAFVATTITTLTIAAAGNEVEVTVGLGTISSGQLLRVAFSSVGVSAPYTVELEGVQQ